nr:unnamed protein product [Spirometra erinaceieuropaei]
MERIAGELGVGIAHRPTATMRSKIMQVKDRLDVGEQSGVVYQIPCRDCPRHYTGQTGRRLSSRITEHKRAVRRGDPLSQIATHTLEEGHEFNFASTRIVARASNKTGRELLESWVSGTSSINRHVEIPPAITRSVPAAKGRDPISSQGCTQSRHHASGLLMGVAYSAARKAARHWNATHRAIRHLEKSKHVKKPLILNEHLSEIEKELLERNPELEKRVTSFSIESRGVKDSILPEGFQYVSKSSRKLPQRTDLGNPIPPPFIDFGFAVPDHIPKGKLTMRQAINLVKSHQLKQKSSEELAVEYNLDPNLANSISKYFSLFEREQGQIWVPHSGKTISPEKQLLDAPIACEDERIPPEGVSRYIRMNDLDTKLQN